MSILIDTPSLYIRHRLKIIRMKPRRSNRKVSFVKPKACRMKRKRSSRTLFFWSNNTHDDETGDNSDEGSNRISKQTKSNDDIQRPQLELLFRGAPYYSDCMPLPYDLLVKIFDHLVSVSDNPIRDLCSVAGVCETWRQIILQCLSLWSRIDLTTLPITDRNLHYVSQIFNQNFKHIREVAIDGHIQCTGASSQFFDELITAPNLTTLSLKQFKNSHKANKVITGAIIKSSSIQNLSITNSRALITFSNSRWISDYLHAHGHRLHLLDLATSMTTIPSTIIRALSSGVCSNLKVLDLSTCAALNDHSLDAVLLAQSLPGLQILRVGSVSFKRVSQVPEKLSLTELRELSMPIAIRDIDRDDALLATLTFGSDRITTLDLRGSSISASALIDLPSYGVKELHMDDIWPRQRNKYHDVIRKWSSTLEVLSLVKINCADTMSSCLKALYQSGKKLTPKIRELDVSSSEVDASDLKKLLKTATHLESVNVSSCRSLPRGCKGKYSKNPASAATQKLDTLKKKLK